MLFLCEMAVDFGLNHNQVVRRFRGGDVRSDSEINVLLVAFNEIGAVVLWILSLPFMKISSAPANQAKW
jgi:hypothetical protein